MTCFARLLGSAAGAAELPVQLPEGFSLWQPSASMRVGLGYKDNVTLSSFAPVGSGFEMTSAEAMLFRLPWNNWQLTAFASGSDTRYFNSSTGVNTEQNAAASAQLAWWMGKGWRSLSSCEYVFINQVMDVSATYGTPLRQEVFGHGLTAKQGFQKELGSYWLQLDGSLARFYFRQPLDSYWQPAGQLALGRYYGYSSDLSLSYRAAAPLYDTREQTDSLGAPLTGTHLRFLPQTFELACNHVWDEQRRWRSSTRLALELNQDNAAGYYDYTQYQLVEQLRFHPAKWELSARLSVSYYDAPHQPLDLAGPESRCRTGIQAGLRAERALTKHWKLYVAYDYERSLSNLAVEEYEANTVSAGTEYAF